MSTPYFHNSLEALQRALDGATCLIYLLKLEALPLYSIERPRPLRGLG